MAQQSLEERVLLKMLQSVQSQNVRTVTPDTQYLDALETLGLAKVEGWGQDHLTPLGEKIKNYLQTSSENWGT